MKSPIASLARTLRARRAAVALLSFTACAVGAAAAGGPTDPIDPIDPPGAGTTHPAANAYRIVRERVPTLGQFRLVKLDTQRIAQRVAQDKPVRLPFAIHAATRMLNPVAQTMDLAIDLNPVQLVVQGSQGLLIYEFLARDGRAETQVEVVERPASYGYGGPIIDEAQGRGHYIIRPDMVLGLTFAPNPPAGNSGLSVIEPVTRLLKKNGATPQEIQIVRERFNHVVYNSAALQGDIPIDYEDSTREHKDHQKGAASRARINQDISIYMMGDNQYTSSYATTDDAFDDQTWTLFGVELITQLAEPGPYGNDEFDIDIDIAGQGLWVLGGPSSTDPATLLEQSYNQFPWSAVSTPVNDIGLTHLFTGKNLDGNTIGKAWKIGGFDDACGTDYSTDSACKQSIAQPVFTGSTWLLEVILMAHEIGHNMDGLHSDCDVNYCAGSSCGRTVMCTPLGSDQILFYSETNATAIADKVDAECASDDC